MRRADATIGAAEWKSVVDDWDNWVKDNPDWMEEFEGMMSIPSLIKRGNMKPEKRGRIAIGIRTTFIANEVPDNPWYSPPPEPVWGGPCMTDDCDNPIELVGPDTTESMYEDEDGYPICGECSHKFEQLEMDYYKKEKEKTKFREEDMRHWPSTDELGGS